MRHYVSQPKTKNIKFMSLVVIFLYSPNKLIVRLSFYIIVNIKILTKNREDKAIVQ